MENLKSSWRARIESGVLHISGMTDKFPYDFFTSGLERIGHEENTLLFKLVFHQDKEPFCDENLIGPVNHWARNIPTGISKVRIYIEPTEYIEISIE